MSFGFSVGDFIAIGQLTWTVYRSCKGAPGEFQELSRELSSLHTILLELEDEAKSPNSLLNRRGSGRKHDLDRLLGNLQGVLKEIEAIVENYQSLGRDQKKTWDRVTFGAKENLTDLRSKLTFHTNAINLFISSLSAGSLARIEGILEELVKDIKSGKKEPTVITTCEDDDDDLAWGEIERELVGDGITEQDVERYKDDIRVYLKELIGEDMGIDPGSNSSLAADMADLHFSERTSTAVFFNSDRDSDRGSTKRGKSKVHCDDKSVSKHKRNRRTESSMPPFPKFGDSKLISYSRVPNEIKNLSVKDVLRPSATSANPVRAIQTDVMNILKKLGVHFTESKSGWFHCDRKLWVQDDKYKYNDLKAVDIRNDEDVVVITGGKGRNWRGAVEGESFSRTFLTTVEFDLFIIKMPLHRAKYGIRFEERDYRGIAKSRTWYFNYVTESILNELKIIWFKRFGS